MYKNLSCTFLLLPLLFLTASCSQEGEFREASVDAPLSLDTESIQDYTSDSIQLFLKGTLGDNTVFNFDQLQFFGDSTCTGSPYGSVVASDFETTGVQISVPFQDSVTLYVSSASSTNCVFLKEVDLSNVGPSAPVFNEVQPPTPSRLVTSPGLFGTANPTSGTVEFFSDATCATALTVSPVENFMGAGVQIVLPANTTTDIYARTKDFRGAVSTCAFLVQYQHSDALSDPPNFNGISHISPSNETTTPTISGTTAVGSTTVSLFSDSGCSDELASGDPAVFLSPGFEVSLTANATSSVYAKSVDDQNQPSVCALLTTYTHDDVDPPNPTFTTTDPTSPTNQTTTPGIIGVAGGDSSTISFFDSFTCQNLIGTGSKLDFEAGGVAVSVGANATSEVYARSFDEAGNDSDCVEMTSFVHNTFPPSSPIFGTTNPSSPSNGTITPFVIGTAAERTVQVNFYSNETCTTLIGQGPPEDYESTGIQVTTTANFENSIYATVQDLEGNVSDCLFHAGYSHSSAPSPDPGFFATFPASPSRATSQPSIIGTADSTIESVVLYDDNTCLNAIGSGSRGAYISSGIIATLPLNSTTNIHAVATDIYGNTSGCAFITQFIHTDVRPLPPTFNATAPLSPNNSSFSPLVTGQALQDPASQLPPTSVSLFDSPSCVSVLGSGTPTDFNTTGLNTNVAQNSITTIYAKSFDDAGNSSLCTYMTDYTHNSHPPARPNFSQTSPASPSYVTETYISGGYGTSPDFMNRVAINFFDDVGCSNQIATGNPNVYETTGILLDVDPNVTTPVYAQSVNEVGTSSDCTFLTNFTHHDSPIGGVNTAANLDGSVNITWLPDLSASPIPRYSVERSTKSGGPFTVIAADLNATSFQDLLVSDNTTYFYRVFATNDTGRGQSSAESMISIAAPGSVTATNLVAMGRDGLITLTWTGFPQNMTYKIGRSTNFAGPFTDLGIDTTLSAYEDTAVTNGQTYYYIITASNPSGLSMQSDMASATARITPAPPTALKMMPYFSLDDCAGARGLRFSWTSSSYFSSYTLLRGTTKITGTNLNNTGLNAISRCNVPNNNVYYYRVQANWGTDFSIPSTEVTGIYTGGNSNLSVFPGDGESLLSWTSPNKPADLSAFTQLYDVYVSDTHDGEYSILAGALTNRNYTHVIANGNGRFYYVESYVIDGDGDKIYVGYPSDIRSGTPNPSPGAPTNLTLNEILDQGRVQLDWTPPDNYNGFQVYRASSMGGPYTAITYETNPLVLNLSVLPGMNYFKVTSVWGSFESADSNIVSFRSAKVNGLSVLPSASDIDLSWTAVTDASDYLVYRATNQHGTYTNIGIVGATSFTDSTALAGQGYFYKVRARFADLSMAQFSDEKAGMRTGSNNPSGLSLEVAGATSLRVSWALVSGATQYQVMISDSFAGTYLVRGSTITDSFNLNGLLPQTEYFVKVRAVIGMNTFDSSVDSKVTYALPSPPSGQMGDGEINLSWTALAGANDYDVLRSTDGVSFSTLVAGYASNNYLDTTAVNGTLYFYRIKVNYPFDTFTSITSLGMSPGNVPLAPTNLSVENNGTGTEATLSWAAVSGITNYSVYRSTSSGSYGAQILSTGSTSGVTVTGLTNGTRYFFIVRANNGTQESADSNEVSFIPSLEPAKPDVEFETASSVLVSWAAVPSASTYDVQRSTDGKTFETITTGLAATTYSDGTVVPADTYFYRYKAYNASGVEMSVSFVSDAVNISVQPETPLAFHAVSSSTTTVDLSWTNVASISGYEILRGTSQGGPYALVASPAASALAFQDTGLTPGTTYYYVMRSYNASGVRSGNSVEVSVNLVAGPTGLALSDVGTAIQANWNAVAGAVTYNLKRSLDSGGPYGTVGNVAGLSFDDTETLAAKTYYYVVEAVFADGSTSVLSGEQSFTRFGFIDLQVPIELTDTPLSSSGSFAIAFERTQTSLDEGAYDGVTSYEFEALVSNSDSVARNVSLVDSSDAVVGAIVVPGNTLSSTRMRVVFAPNLGSDVYRLALDQTNSDGELAVLGAKVLVNQTNATRTKLYFPMLSSSQSPSNLDFDVFAAATTSETYSDLPSSLLYNRETSKLSSIEEYNGWEFEAVVAASNISEGIVAFRNHADSSIVSNTETRFLGNTIQLASVPFDEGVSHFTSADEGKNFDVVLRCEQECDTGDVRLYKAGLWVRLENLSAARVKHRLHALKETVSSQEDFTDERALVDTSLYSTPEVYFQAVTFDDGSSSGDIDLLSSVQDSGSAGLVPVVGSSLSIDADGVALQNSSAIAIPSGQRFMSTVNPTSGSLDVRASFLVIDTDSNP